MTSQATFDAHEIHGSLRAAIASVEAAQGTEAFRDDPAAVAIAAEAAAVLKRTEGVLALVQAEATPVALLNDLAAALSPLQGYLSQAQPWTPAAVAGIDSGLREIVRHAARFLPLAIIDPDRVNDATAALAASAREAAQALRARLDDLDATVDRLVTKQQDAEASFDAAAAGAESRFNAKLGDLETALAAQTGAIASLTKTWTDASATATQAQATEFATLIQTSKNQIENAVAEANGMFKELQTRAAAELQDLKTNVEASSAEIIKHLTEQRDVVDGLYKTIAVKGTAGAFHDEANYQRGQANLFRWLSLGTLALAAAIATSIVALEPSLPLASPAFVSKVAIALLLGAASTYMAQQSGHHRKIEGEYRRLQVEVAALPPFIYDLDETTQTALKKEFVGRAFVGHQDSLTDEPGGASLGKEQVTLFGQIIDTIRKIR